ncbi:MAG TPA: extracellular solute-binding protein [Solirubrobacteraceae bacterium]|nr:extracellular solute-binding protein [Solirubrobacteraceae bacterium]
MTRRRRPTKAVLMVIAAAALACAVVVASAGAASKTTLRVDVFGDFGYKPLYKQYMKTHPNIVIKEDSEDYQPHHDGLVKHLATGAGADDVVAIEVGFVSKFDNTPQYFVDLRKLGGMKEATQYPKWKYEQAIAKDGSLIGLGTDVGSLAICYRADLFKQAGLPSDPTAVSKLWPTWGDYLKAGKKFQANAPSGTYFYDSGSNIYNAIIAQANPAYYNKAGKLLVSSNPKVKQAWNVAVQGYQAGLDAGLAAYSTAWTTGFKKSTFASVTCPAWMMGYIQTSAPAFKGDWNVADVPGGKGGSWGGSFLAIPKQSKHQAEAWDLLKFLTSPESQTYVFKHTGNLPSRTAVLKSSAVQGFKNPFFQNAPVGKIFARNALALTPQSLGPNQGDIQTAVSNAIQRVEQKKQSPDQAWAQFLKDVKSVTST